MRAILFLLAAAILGLTGGYAWSNWSKPSPAAVANAPSIPSAKPGQTSAELEESAYYADCAAAEKAGKAPLYPGQPGYRTELDPQGVGVACQPGAAG
jgi:excalibur calcium-binding domain-containing protein